MTRRPRTPDGARHVAAAPFYGMTLMALAIFAVSRRADSSSYRYLLPLVWCFPFIVQHLFNAGGRLVKIALGALADLGHFRIYYDFREQPEPATLRRLPAAAYSVWADVEPEQTAREFAPRWAGAARHPDGSRGTPRTDTGQAGRPTPGQRQPQWQPGRDGQVGRPRGAYIPIPGSSRSKIELSLKRPPCSGTLNWAR